VELLQLHNPLGAATGGRLLAAREVLRPGGVADVFDKLREEGYFGHHGVTALGETPAILEVLRSGRFDTAQVYHNMLNPSAARPVPPGWGGQDFGGVLEACRERDVGVMAIRVLAAGALASDERHGREVVVAADADLGREVARARRIFDRLGGSVRHAGAGGDPPRAGEPRPVDRRRGRRDPGAAGRGAGGVRGGAAARGGDGRGRGLLRRGGLSGRRGRR
jgi:L-glyceraldehyde 3-phosphate reductase